MKLTPVNFPALNAHGTRYDCADNLKLNYDAQNCPAIVTNDGYKVVAHAYDGIARHATLTTCRNSSTFFHSAAGGLFSGEFTLEDPVRIADNPITFVDPAGLQVQLPDPLPDPKQVTVSAEVGLVGNIKMGDKDLPVTQFVNVTGTLEIGRPRILFGITKDGKGAKVFLSVTWQEGVRGTPEPIGKPETRVRYSDIIGPEKITQVVQKFARQDAVRDVSVDITIHCSTDVSELGKAAQVIEIASLPLESLAVDATQVAAKLLFEDQLRKLDISAADVGPTVGPWYATSPAMTERLISSDVQRVPATRP